MERLAQASQLYSALRKLSPGESRGILTEALRLYKVKRLVIASGVDPVTALKIVQDDARWTFGHFIGDSDLLSELYSLVSSLSLGDFLKFYARHRGMREFPYIFEELMNEIVPQPVIAGAGAVSVVGADAFIVWINEIARRFPQTELVLTSSSNPISSELLREMLFDLGNVRFLSGHEAEGALATADAIVAIPLICAENMGIPLSHIPREGLEAWAIEMVARKMRGGARLYAIISERPLFSKKCNEFRERLISSMSLESIQALPESVLIPYSRMKLSCLVVSKRWPTGEVELVKYFILPPPEKSGMKDVEIAAERGHISTFRLRSEQSWVVDRLLRSPLNILSSFLRPGLPTTRLIDLCWTIFRGTGPIKEELRDEIGDIGHTYGLIDMRDIQV